MEQKRQTQRQRVIKGGIIYFNEHRSSLDCMVRNVSDTGARLKVESTATIPDNFDLLIKQEGQLYPAEVVWRNMVELGIRFTGAPKSKLAGR